MEVRTQRCSGRGRPAPASRPRPGGCRDGARTRAHLVVAVDTPAPEGVLMISSLDPRSEAGGIARTSRIPVRPLAVTEVPAGLSVLPLPSAPNSASPQHFTVLSVIRRTRDRCRRPPAWRRHTGDRLRGRLVARGVRLHDLGAVEAPAAHHARCCRSRSWWHCRPTATRHRQARDVTGWCSTCRDRRTQFAVGVVAPAPHAAAADEGAGVGVAERESDTFDRPGTAVGDRPADPSPFPTAAFVAAPSHDGLERP